MFRLRTLLLLFLPRKKQKMELKRPTLMSEFKNFKEKYVLDLVMSRIVDKYISKPKLRLLSAFEVERNMLFKKVLLNRLLIAGVRGMPHSQDQVILVHLDFVKITFDGILFFIYFMLGKSSH